MEADTVPPPIKEDDRRESGGVEENVGEEGSLPLETSCLCMQTLRVFDKQKD